MQNEERINVLETQVRTLKRIVYGFGCLLVAGIVVGATSLQTVPDVIQAKMFEVVNSYGTVIAKFGLHNKFQHRSLIQASRFDVVNWGGKEVVAKFGIADGTGTRGAGLVVGANHTFEGAAIWADNDGKSHVTVYGKEGSTKLGARHIILEKMKPDTLTSSRLVHIGSDQAGGGRIRCYGQDFVSYDFP